jgi:hypothetical protein
LDIQKEKDMQFELFWTFAALLLGAGGMYVVLEYRIHGERQDSTAKYLKAQSDTLAIRKEMQGYTKYAEYLAAGKAEIADKLKLVLVKVSREYAHSEEVPKETFKLTAPFLLLVRYSVEYSFNIDFKTDPFEVRQIATGIEIIARKPLLLGYPSIAILSHEISADKDLVDPKNLVNEVQVKLPAVVRKDGTAIASEDATLALWEKKLVECLRTFLLTQAGVKQVPAISVVFK